ncbi:MAG: transposase, partial [Bacteroidales bacterium]|nr:transposase [Bacteroidales bacterium]
NRLPILGRIEKGEMILNEFVRAFKTFSSRWMNELDNTPGKTRWQSRFHDHIIRDEREFIRIQQYIRDNPLSWENDSLKS